MAVLPAPSGYVCVRTSGNFQVSTGNAKVIPTGSYIYIPTARSAAFIAAGGGVEVTVEPSYSAYPGFGAGDGKWDNA